MSFPALFELECDGGVPAHFPYAKMVLSEAQRAQIHSLLADGVKGRVIARRARCSPSSIKRERRRLRLAELGEVEEVRLGRPPCEAWNEATHALVADLLKEDPTRSVKTIQGLLAGRDVQLSWSSTRRLMKSSRTPFRPVATQQLSQRTQKARFRWRLGM